jgi:YjbE family integral membrane protein
VGFAGVVTDELWTQALQVIGIIWIDLVLSGDNAVVIALACRGLPPHRRKLGIVLGTGTAVVLRLIFALLVVHLLAVPFLKIAGSLLLLWIAVKLLDDTHGDESVPETDRLWRAVGTIAMADAVMSLDNVFAIVAVAGESVYLLIFGLAVSIPLIVAGASLVMKLLERFPFLTWAGAGLLGWVAGHMLVTDPWMHDRLVERGLVRYELAASIVGALLVLALGFALRRWRAAGAARTMEVSRS